MKIEICDSYEEISSKAKNIILENLSRHKELLLCAATGGSPTLMYQLLAKEYMLVPELFSKLKVIKLDEWGGIPMTNEGTCESYLQEHVINPLKISKDRYLSLLSNPADPKAECDKIEHQLSEHGQIDICILGLGMNGHIAFNEPAEYLHPYCHVAQLAEKSLTHPMISGEKQKPSYGLTLGMANILQSKLIIVLINGEKKKEITQAFLSQKITNQLPASYLWLHPNVICLVDKDAVGFNSI